MPTDRSLNVTLDDSALLRLLVEHTPVAIAILDRDLCYLATSRHWLIEHGLEGEDLVGRRHDEVLPALAARWRDAHRRVLGGETEPSREGAFTRADGLTEWIEWEARPWRTPDGAVGGVVMLTRVITTRRRAETERARLTHELNERVKELTLLHTTARLLEGARDIDGALLDELARLLPPAWQHPEVCEGSIRFADASGQTAGFRESPWMQRATFSTGDGRQGVVEVAYTAARPTEVEGPFLREERALIQSFAEMLGAQVERRRAQRELQRAEEKFASLFKAAPVGIALVDAAEGAIVDVNDEFERLTGYPRAQALGRRTTEVGLWSERNLRDLPLDGVAGASGVAGLEIKGRARDGRVVPLRYSAQAIVLDARVFLLLAFLDVTEEKRAEASIRASEARLRRVVESTMLGFAFADSEGTIHAANGECLRIMGRREDDVIHGRLRFDALLSPRVSSAHGDAVGDLASVAGSRAIEMAIVRPDGTEVPVLVGAAKVDDRGDERVAFLLDLTERHALREQLERAQRLEAVGKLAAGVAHDFNNILAVISMSAELLRTELPALHPAMEYTAEITQAAQRAAGLTRQLLAFSRQQVMEPRVIRLDGLLLDLDKMLRRMLGRAVTYTLRSGAPEVAVRADASQLQQVVLNLAINARDAMSGGGSLTIETAIEEHPSPVRVGDVELPAGSYAALYVTDTGCGIDAVTRARMFDPFFTTKQPGRGTGLGLATVYGIVRQSHGAIDVVSERGAGARFRVLLPRVDGAVEEAPPRAEVRELGGRETLLVVEDDPIVLRMLQRVLKGLGYTVLGAGHPREATALVAEYRGAIDLLLSDLVMPGGNGRALADRMVEAHPAMRVILMSGYTDDASLQSGDLASGHAFLQKPFSNRDLAQRVREVLDGPAPGG